MTARPSPFPPRTGLGAEIDTLIERLVELRSRSVCNTGPNYDDSADDLHELAHLANDVARAVDPLFQRIARDAGMASMSGSSVYDRVVSDYALNDLLGEIAAKAALLEEDRAPVENENEQHRLTGRQLGLRRF